jgi:hypothetical protein
MHHANRNTPKLDMIESTFVNQMFTATVPLSLLLAVLALAPAQKCPTSSIAVVTLSTSAST